MKFKYFSIFIFLFLLICCANAIYAVSDDNILELDQSDDIISADDSEIVSIAEAATLSASQEEEVLTAESTSSSASDSSVSSVAPLSQFKKDLENKKDVVNLTGNIEISKPFDVRYNVVIDGQGHTIDGQKTTCLFEVRSSTVTFKNLIFKNGKAENGGAIYAYCANVFIKNCTFKNNKATVKGGAIYISNGKLNVDKSTFTGNTAKGDGGAIYTYLAPLTVKSSAFKNNKVQSGKKQGHGGAIYTFKKSSKITDTTFTSNFCLSTKLKKHSQATKYQYSAGAIYYNLGTTHTLTGCTFTKNKASNHGGAVYAHQPSKSMTINKCTFKSNRVLWEDGGTITFNGKKLIMKNSNFINNLAYEDGGVMDACSLTKKNIRFVITGCTFKGNKAYKGGGAIWIGKKTVYTFKNNKFINNEAGMGGALFSEAGISTVTNCLFQGNKARNIPSWRVRNKAGQILKNHGGALVMQNKKLTITKCTFKNNRALASGGVCFHMGGKLILKSNKFSGNKAKKGNKIQKY